MVPHSCLESACLDVDGDPVLGVSEAAAAAAHHTRHLVIDQLL